MPLPQFLESLNCASGKSSQFTRRLSSRRKSSNKSGGNTSTLRKSTNEINTYGPSAPVVFDPNYPDVTPSLARKASVESLNETNFWDIGKYKIALKRCDNGQKLGSELADMISERAKLEDNYGKALKQWQNKWNQHLNTESSDYGTTKNAWYAFINSGSKTADVHLELSKTLINNPVIKIKDWIKRNYQRHIINYKKTKEFEDLFQEAQSSWLTLYEKMKKAKKEYIQSIETAKSCMENLQSAETNPRFSLDQRNKLQVRSEKAKEEQNKAREKYKESIIEMDLYRPRYIENMTEVFNRTQNFEHERMVFFKQILLESHGLLQIQSDKRFEELFEDLVEQVNRINPENDLEWWSQNYGVGTSPNWPVFEDYD